MRRAAARAALAAAWSVGWLLAGFAAVDRLGAIASPDGELARFADEVVAMPSLLLSMSTGLDIPPVPMLALSAAAVAIVAAAAALLLLRLLRALDPAADTLRALGWSLWTLPCLLLWSLPIAIAGVAVASIESTASVAPMVVALVAAVLVLAMLVRGDVVERPRAPLAWWPRWPGLLAFALALAAGTASLLGEVAIGFVQDFAGAWLGWLLDAALWSAGWPVVAVVLRTWMDRHRWTTVRARTRRWIGWPSIRRLIALDLRVFGTGAIVLVPPVIVFSLWSVFLAPQFRLSADADGVALPAWTTWPSYGVVESLWIVGLPLVWCLAFAQARTLRALDAGELGPAPR